MFPFLVNMPAHGGELKVKLEVIVVNSVSCVFVADTKEGLPRHLPPCLRVVLYDPQVIHW